MVNSSSTDTDDLSPGEANDVLLDITDTQQTEGNETPPPGTEPEEPLAVDPNDGVANNGEEVPKDPDEVEGSSATAERLQRHAGVSPPETDSATRME